MQFRVTSRTRLLLWSPLAPRQSCEALLSVNSQADTHAPRSTNACYPRARIPSLPQASPTYDVSRDNLLLRFAGCCVLKTANKRQAACRILIGGINERQFAAHFDLKAAADPLDLSFKFAKVSQYPNFSDVKAGIRWIDSNPQFLFLRQAPSKRTQLLINFLTNFDVFLRQPFPT
jgi:hypothetical protein